MSRRVSMMASPIGIMSVSSPKTPIRLTQGSQDLKKPIKNRVSESLNKRISKKDENI